MYELRAATPDDYEFLYDLLVATMKEYVRQIWGWEETEQRERFRARFAPEKFEIVVVEGQNVGAVSVERRPSEWFLSEIQILPAFQRRRLGTAIIQNLVREAGRQALPVGLQVLKINPARGLYDRLGFAVTGETDTHYLMSRPV